MLVNALWLNATLLATRMFAAIIIYGKVYTMATIAMPFLLGALALAVGRLGFMRAAYALGIFAIFEAGTIGTPFWTTMCFNLGHTFPMIDATLVRIDSLFGFDWVTYLSFFESHPYLNVPLRPAYESIFWQPLVICVALVLLGLEITVVEFLSALMLSLTCTVAIAIVAPAYDAYHYFNVSPAMHPHLDIDPYEGTKAAVDWLRSATATGPMPTFHGGLITFPSFHTTSAFLFVWYSRKSLFLLCPAVLLNATMLVSTPLHGSHHLADLLAGALVAIFAISMSDWFCRRPRTMAEPLTNAPLLDLENATVRFSEA